MTEANQEIRWRILFSNPNDMLRTPAIWDGANPTLAAASQHSNNLDGGVNVGRKKYMFGRFEHRQVFIASFPAI
jgi:hypothetical protein